MELELIEPELYFLIVESSATTLADAIIHASGTQV